MVEDSMPETRPMANADALVELFQGESYAYGDTSAAMYPEALLLQTPQGNKYYASFQSYNKQFIGNGTDSMVRWTNSNIESNQRRIVGKWLGTELKPELVSSQKKHTRSRSTANALFSWSSGDSYIAARKRELQRETGERPPSPATEELPQTTTVPVESVQNRLNRIIEVESNTFIHARIQTIRAHHTEQINKQINERKRKDLEAHLSKLRIKEAEYDKQMEAALADQSLNKHGFLGSLFGFSSTQEKDEKDEKEDQEVDKEAPKEAPKEASKEAKDTTPRNKRFSFLPANSLWSKEDKRHLKQDEIQEDKEHKEQNEEQNEEQKDHEPNSDPTVPTTPAPVKSESADSDSDDFEDFFSATPIKEIIHPETKPTVTEHKFIPVQTQSNHEINQDLLDIFGPTQHTHSKDEDLLSF